MGKGKDKGGKHGGKQFSAPEEIDRSVSKQKGSRDMPPDDDDDDDEEEEVMPKQNANAGMMPPDDDDDDEDDGSDEDDESDDDAEEAARAAKRAAAGKALDKLVEAGITASDAHMAWVKKELEKRVAAAAQARSEEAARAAKKAAKKAGKEEEEEDDEPDPDMMAKLELVRKRREAQAKQRIAKDGWDRMKPMSADNHPPGWNGQTAADLS